MNFSAFHYCGAKTRRTDVRHFCPELILSNAGSFHTLSLCANAVWNGSLKSKLFFNSGNVFNCLNLHMWSLFIPSLSKLDCSRELTFLWLKSTRKRKIPDTRHFQKDLSANSGPFMVSMVMAAWFLRGIENFAFDFDLFKLPATPCCYDCSC